MSIKSKKWYQGQIQALENAVKNTSNLAIQSSWTTDNIKLTEIAKFNIPVFNEVSKLNTKLNKLKSEYSFYYR